MTSGTDSHRANLYTIIEKIIESEPYTLYTYPAQNDAVERERAAGYAMLIARMTVEAISAASEKGPISPTAITAENGSQPCAPCVERRSGARAWLLSGGGGHEDGEDGLRAMSVSGEGLVEFLTAYEEYLTDERNGE